VFARKHRVFLQALNINKIQKLSINTIMTSQEIRQSFLDFFASKNHKIVPSAPMVIKDDPTLMFTNAGMNQFKTLSWATIRSNIRA